MAQIHLPDLAAIYRVEDLEVRFYATVGACISLVAAVEHDLFDLYMDASGLTPEQSAPVFYRFVKFSHKRDTADAAIRVALARNNLLTTWERLLHDVQALAGEDAARNVLGHNSVNTELEVKLTPEGADVYERFVVDQNANQVLARMRRPRREDLNTLENYAQRLVTLRLRLTRFAPRLRKVCGRPREQDAAVLAAIPRRRRTKRPPPTEPLQEP